MGSSVTEYGFDNSGIDRCTVESIYDQYPLNEQIKLIRKAIVNLGYKDKQFLEFNDFVEAEVATGKQKKSKSSTVIVSAHDESNFKPGYPKPSINQYEEKKREERKYHE